MSVSIGLLDSSREKAENLTNWLLAHDASWDITEIGSLLIRFKEPMDDRTDFDELRQIISDAHCVLRINEVEMNRQ